MRDFLWLWAALLPVPLIADDAADGELAERAMRALETGCYRCHGGANGLNAGLDVLSQESLLQPRGEGAIETAFVIPGDPANSLLWQAIESEYMPLEGSREAEDLTADDRMAIRDWIAAGAPMVERRDFEVVTETQVQTAIRNYLYQARAEDRRHLRFFTLHHLHNNPTVTARDLRYTRAALSKLLNSVNWQSADVVLPEALEETSDTVFVIDLRDFDWDAAIWETLLDHYPYGVHHEFSEDDDLQQLAADLTLFSGTNLPSVRADWFVVYASQPPLYNVLLDLPDHLDELTDRLGIDIEQNFLDAELDRSAFTRSGVSSQNRLIERHEIPAGGYFWISYDFKAGRSRGDLVRFPLGPVFDGNPFLQQAFEHDGGEIIWSLPNGMQGYMLVLGSGERLDEPGPIDIVYDSAAIMGTPAIINGVSCINCHSQGMITRFRDEIRLSRAVGGPVRDQVLELYPTHEEMQELITGDQERFLAALERVTGPFLEDNDQGEPIGKVVSRYFSDLSPVDVACELGVNDPEVLQLLINSNPDLLALGLGVLAQEPAGSLKRVKWEALEVTGPTLIQEVLRITQPGCMPVAPSALQSP